MKIAVFGATGESGKYFTKQALARGYELKLLVRNEGKLTEEIKSKSTVIVGSVEDQQKVSETIEGCDAVVSLIGHTKTSGKTMQTDGINNMVSSMKKFNLKRLISLTGAGVATTGDNPKLMDKAVTFLLGTFAKDVLNDGIAHAEIIKKSDLDWTIVRGPMLNNNPAKNSYKLGMVGDSGMDIKISREDLATAILDMLDNKETFGKMPVVAWGK